MLRKAGNKINTRRNKRFKDQLRKLVRGTCAQSSIVSRVVASFLKIVVKEESGGNHNLKINIRALSSKHEIKSYDKE